MRAAALFPDKLMGDRLSNTCDECERPWDEFGFCDSLCTLQSCETCTVLLKMYGTGAEMFDKLVTPRLLQRTDQ